MNRRLAISIGLLLVGGPVALRSQLQYDATTFIPGLGATSAFWTRRGSIDSLGRRVVLKEVRNSNPYTLAGVASQSREVLYNWASSGLNVFVGHSMGGLVARRAAFEEPWRAAGILTVASPHRGALIADNIRPTLGYVAATIATVQDALVRGVFGLSAGEKVAQAANLLLRYGLEEWLRGMFPLDAAAVADLTTTSAAVASLNRPDGFPHAAIYGSIDRRLAWLKVLLSSANKDESFPTYEKLYNGTVWIFRGCMVFRLFIIWSPEKAWHCLRGHQALTRIDERWMFFTTGFSKGAAFDGLLPAATTAYPGTTLADGQTNLRVPGHNHIDIMWRLDGIRAMAHQMVKRLNMEPTGTTADGGGAGGGGGGGGDGCIECFLPASPSLKTGMVSRVQPRTEATARKPPRW